MTTLIDIDRLKTIWKGMKARCQNPRNQAYDRYGGRGISVCEGWQEFEAFAGWAIVHGYRDDREIDRVDPAGNYEPANCRWIAGALNRSRRGLVEQGPYTGKLTTEIIDEALATRSRLNLRDGNGLVLHLNQSTSSWRWSFRFDGKERLLTYGQYPSISLAEAREMHAVARHHRASGKNPAAMKQRSRARYPQH